MKRLSKIKMQRKTRNKTIVPKDKHIMKPPNKLEGSNTTYKTTIYDLEFYFKPPPGTFEVGY
jgi:hypothetical protein